MSLATVRAGYEKQNNISNRINKLSGVFTPAGLIVLFASLVILIRSLILRNSYEIVLTSAVLLFLLITGIIGIWKSKKLKSMEPGWKPPFPVTAQLKQRAQLNQRAKTGTDNETEDTLVTGLESNIPLFFRLHFSVMGKFFPSGSETGCGMSAETSVPRGETTAKLPLDFPMSGIFRGEGVCQLRDIFGFFSFSCGQVQQRTINVRCAPCFGKKTAINAQTGAEDQRSKPSADIERYYMREYTPGDRFRDINWKSSEKIDTLITRISTDNQEKVSRIEVYFRNYGATGSGRRISLEALWLLDRTKARLSYFLRTLMEQNPNFIFDVRSADKSWEIEDQEDLDAFFEELAALSLLPPQKETAIQQGAGDIYVFSAACDTGLPAFLLACNPRPVTLFMIQPEENKTKTQEQSEKTEILFRNNFSQKGFFVSPGWFKKNIKRLNAQAARTEMFYAEIKS